MDPGTNSLSPFDLIARLVKVSLYSFERWADYDETHPAMVFYKDATLIPKATDQLPV
jgi:hypothetical protein